MTQQPFGVALLFGFCIILRFEKGFAQYAAPLHRLVGELQGKRKKRGSGTNTLLEGRWTEVLEKASVALKRLLTPVFFSKPFVLEIDASQVVFIISVNPFVLWLLVNLVELPLLKISSLGSPSPEKWGWHSKFGRHS